MRNIRPYVAVAESIARTAPNLLQIHMPGVIVGPAVDEKRGYGSDLNFNVANNIDIAGLKQTPATGRVYKIAGIRSGSTLDVNSLQFGGRDIVSAIQYGTDAAPKNFKAHVKSASEKHILVLADGAGNVAEADLVDKGMEAGDTLVITDGTNTIETKVRSFTYDNGVLQINLWEEVEFAPDENTELTIVHKKHFDKVELEPSGFVFESVQFGGESVLVKGPGTFTFAYFVYKPTDKTPDLTNISVSTKNMIIPNMSSSAVSAEVENGVLYNWFAADRTDIANQFVSVDYRNYKDVLGEASERNKLGTAFELIAKEVPGFALKAFVTESDSSDAYTSALARIATSDQAYEVAVLSDDEAVLAALKGAVDKAADPMVASFKLGLFAGKVPFYTVKLSLDSATVTDNGDGTFTVVGSGFDIAGVEEGDLVIGSEDYKIAEGEYYKNAGETFGAKVVAKVVSVVTSSKLIVAPIVAGTAVADALSGQGIKIIKKNGTSEIKEAIKSKVSGLDDMHLVYIMPDKFMSGDKIYAGYYLAAILAAVMAHLPPQQGLSNLSLNSIDRVLNSSGLFTDDELDDIASAGVTVVLQAGYDSKPYILRQLTTNMSSLEEMEINKVRCLDFAALAVKDVVDDYVGKRNVSERNATEVRNRIESRLKNIIKETKNEVLGSVITDYEISNVSIPDGEPDAIAGGIEVTTPTSLNKIRLFIKSRS